MSKFQEANRLLVTGKAADAIRLYGEHAKECPDEAAKAFTKAAIASLRMNIIGEPIEIEPGSTLVSQGDRRSADVFFRRALAANDAYVPALLGLAEIVDDLDERIVLLERALAIRPDLGGYLGLGEAYIAAQKLDAAYDAFRKAQQHNELDGGGYDALQRVCRMMGREEEAEKWSCAWKTAYARKPRVDGKGRAG